MYLTVKNDIEGKRITKEVCALTACSNYGIGFLTSFIAGIASVFGFRNKLFEKKIKKARNDCVSELAAKAKDRGCNAIVAVKFDCSGLTMFAYGQGVVVDDKVDSDTKPTIDNQ